MFWMKKILSSFVLLGLISTLNAELALPKIFSDNMVLQQGQSAKVWGKADKGAKIEVEFLGVKTSATADNDGKWVLYLKNLKASDNSLEIKIFENAKLSKTIKNVLIGEVWMTGGQSNMEFGINSSDEYKKRLSQNASFPMIRYFHQPRTVVSPTPNFDSDKDSCWIICDSQNFEKYRVNAAAFYFAEELRKDMNVPVGLVSSAHGGTPMAAWVDSDSFNNSENFAEKKADFEKRKSEYSYEDASAKREKALKAHQEKVDEAAKNKKKKPTTPSNLTELHKPWPDSPDSFRTPSYLFNGKVAPVAGYTIKGFLWYQGENDCSEPSRYTFDKQMMGVIISWRKVWGDDTLPFIFAQLPSYGVSSDAWAYVRSLQTKAFKQTKNCGMAVLIDAGEEKDIHPKDKTTVGKRFEKIALKLAYGKNDVPAYGPFYKSFKASGKKALVAFDMQGQKFKALDSASGFEVLDENGQWLPATAKVLSDTVELECEKASQIKGVRYAYKSWAKPDVSVFAENSLPLAPFNSKLGY